VREKVAAFSSSFRGFGNNSFYDRDCRGFFPPAEPTSTSAGFDIVFDSVGGANMLNSFEAAALNGQIASTVAMCELDLTLAHFKGLSLHVVFMLIPMLHGYQREVHGEILGKLAAVVDAGGLTPVLDETEFSLEDAGEAYARLESGKAMGKVVITH